MAGPWERYQAAAVDAGPWDKFKPKTDEWERAMLLPMEKNKRTGEPRLAWPQIAVDIGNALTASGNAVRGEYNDVLADPETGAVEPFNREMMVDAATLAGVPALGAGGVAVTAEMAAARSGGMNPTARKIFLRGLRDDQVPLSEVGPRLNAIGPDAVPADLGPRLQTQAQSIATMPGPGQKTVVDALRLRAAGRDSRIISDVDQTLGPAPVPSAIKAGIREGQDALSPYYQRAMNGASRVDTSPIALSLDSAIVNLRGEAQAAAKKVRGMLNVVGTNELDPAPQTLLETRKAIDGMMGNEKDTNVLGFLGEVRKQVDEMLGQAAPGVKEVDAMFAELARQKEGFDTGTQILRTGPEAPHPSDVIEQMLSGGTPQGLGVGPSAVPFRLSQGARADIDRLIGTKANDLQALKQAVGGEGDWNRAKLAAVFGEEKADQLLAIITREMRYKQLEDDALGGSRTQKLRAGHEEIAGKAPKTGVIQSLMDLKPGTAAAAGVDKTLGWASRANRERVNAALAEALMTQDRAKLVEQLRHGGPSIMSQLLINGATRGTLLERDNLQKYVDELLARGPRRVSQ